MVYLDETNRKMLDILQLDGRISYKELGQRVGLTPPAVAERMRKLEEAGVIKGFRAIVDYEVLGFPLLCIIRMNVGGQANLNVDQTLADTPQIIEANRVTGSDSHVVRARVRNTFGIEELLRDVWKEGDTITNLVTSSPVPFRPMNLAATDAGREHS
ncbi:MAG: Lrp/AsnC family transcriptional regulator [Acidimicrobiales bacterium]